MGDGRHVDADLVQGRAFVMLPRRQDLLPSYVNWKATAPPVCLGRREGTMGGGRRGGGPENVEQGSYVYWSHLPDDFIDGILNKDTDPDVIRTAGAQQDAGRSPTKYWAGTTCWAWPAHSTPATRCKKSRRPLC